MLPRRRTPRIAMSTCIVLAGSTVMAQANPTWVDPPSSQPEVQVEPGGTVQTELGATAAEQTKQDDPASVEPANTTASDLAAPPQSVLKPVHTASVSNHPVQPHQAARDL